MKKPSGVPDCNGGTPDCRIISPDQCHEKYTWCPKWQRIMRPLAYQDAPSAAGIFLGAPAEVQP